MYFPSQFLNIFKIWVDKAYEEIKVSFRLNIPCHLLGIKMSVMAGLPEVLISDGALFA